MIVQRFQYPELLRKNEDGKRVYYSDKLPGTPSVTTILSATKPEEDRAALDNWKKKVGVARAQQITTEAASRGTRMHTYLERYILNEEMSAFPSNPMAHKSWFMAAELILNEFKNVDEVWATEAALHYEDLWAGTTDCVGLWKGKPAIIDFKQTNKPKKEEWIDDYKLQLAAYALAHDNMFGTDIDQGVILMVVAPKEDNDKPQVQVFEVVDDFITWKEKWFERVSEYYSKN